MKKLFTLGIMSALACANITAQTLTMIPVDEETLTTFLVQHMAPNGKYISGYAASTGQPIVADWQNGDVKVFENVTGAETPWVNSDGTAVGYNRQGSVKLNFQTGEYEDIDPTDEAGIRGVCEAITEDGTVIVGAYIDTDWNETACYWENGLRKDLPVPTADELGFEIDGAHAKYISKDGSIIVGYLNMIPVLDPMVIWQRQADGTYQCNPICKDWVRVNDDAQQAANPYKKFTPAGISPDGQFIAVNIRDYYSDDDWDWPEMKIGRYEVATGKLEVFELEDLSCTAEAIANDGTIVGETEGLDTYGIILRPGDEKPQAMYIVYGIDEFFYFDTYGGHEVKAISEDARYIAGVGPVMKGESIFPSGRDAYVLDTKSETTAITAVNKGERSKAAYYTVDGRKSNAPVKGLNIVKTAAGQTKKVLVK